MPSLKPHGQMSEAFITALFLSVSGGLQDVYTYLYRGKVFANAQTGNIVLMAVKLFAGEWGEALRYLMPLCAFALGIFVAEFIRLKLKRMQWLHWRQLVVLFEILLLFVVGFLPQELNLLANSIVSFSCAKAHRGTRYRRASPHSPAKAWTGGRQHQSLRQGASLLRHHLPVRAGCRPWQPCTGPHGQPGHLAFLPAALHQLLPDVPERGH